MVTKGGGGRDITYPKSTNAQSYKMNKVQGLMYNTVSIVRLLHYAYLEVAKKKINVTCCHKKNEMVILDLL